MDKYEIIRLKKKGWSDRKIQREFGVSRNTTRKYWSEYCQNLEKLLKTNPETDTEKIIEDIIEKPRYDSSGRKPRKYNEEIDSALRIILNAEETKQAALGMTHKQKLSKKQIHQLLLDEGYDIGYTTISTKIREILNEKKEVFIKQEYEFADRFEYDFGETWLIINGVKTKGFLAVITSPASGFRWAYLYRNAKMEVFLDSHVRFFEMLGGCFREGVYDNMRNVVSRFTGRNEKELNEKLVQMSLYYGFNVNVTNCYRGNEKGTVEDAVRWVRNKTFALKYSFDSFEEAGAYLEEKLTEINADSSIEEEKKYLTPYRPPFETAEISTRHVDKYSFIHVAGNIYSVPEDLVGKEVVVKVYPQKISVLYGNNIVATHPRLVGKGKTHVEISHYLHAFTRKPGALKNSLALKSRPELKHIFDIYYKTRPKLFIEILRENADKDMAELREMLVPSGKDVSDNSARVHAYTLRQIDQISSLFIGGKKPC